MPKQEMSKEDDVPDPADELKIFDAMVRMALRGELGTSDYIGTERSAAYNYIKYREELSAQAAGPVMTRTGVKAPASGVLAVRLAGAV